jgi:hypothetical protein
LIVLDGRHRERKLALPAKKLQCGKALARDARIYTPEELAVIVADKNPA